MDLAGKDTETSAKANSRSKAATGTVDLSLFLLEHLVASHKPVGVSDLARAFHSTKPTIYRHLQALVKHGFARQDKDTNRYEAGIKLLVLGESLREGFNIVALARSEMSMLREATGQAVSLSTWSERRSHRAGTPAGTHGGGFRHQTRHPDGPPRHGTRQGGAGFRPRRLLDGTARAAAILDHRT